jgi:hypothetical protein
MRHFLFVTLAVYALLVCGWSQEQQNKNPCASSQQANPKQNGTENAPFVVKIITADQTQKEPQTTQNIRTNNPQRWGLSDKIAAIAGFAAMLQFLALVVTILIMVRNGRRQLRAYVLPDVASIIDGTMLTPPQPARINIPGIGMLIKNCGQTPAYKVVSWAQIAVIPIQNENTALAIPPIQEQFFNTLGAGSTFNKAIWFDRPLAANEIADIALGTRAVYLYGRIEYRDAFRKHRFSDFRLRYTGQFPPIPNAVLNFSETGNDAN